MSKSLLIALLLIAPAHASTDTEQQVEVLQAETEVDQRRDELAEARREGNQEEIDQHEGELDDALKELNEAGAE